MFGFYKLALKILKDNSLAVIAFVLLSFSSLSTRVFDSYIMMILTPTVWFFYFGFIFGCSGQRGALLGMVFCTMLLMTTYIPFEEEAESGYERIFKFELRTRRVS